MPRERMLRSPRVNPQVRSAPGSDCFPGSAVRAHRCSGFLLAPRAEARAAVEVAAAAVAAAAGVAAAVAAVQAVALAALENLLGCPNECQGSGLPNRPGLL